MEEKARWPGVGPGPQADSKLAEFVAELADVADPTLAVRLVEEQIADLTRSGAPLSSAELSLVQTMSRLLVLALRTFEPVTARPPIGSDLERQAAELKGAIETGELVLAYQPIFSLRSGAIAALEALVRWQHPTRGLLGPDSFIPLAEESGQIAALGRWVLSAACHQGALWRAKYPGYPGLQVGVNISAIQLVEPGLVEDVREALEVSGLHASCLTLEITETVLMEDYDVVVSRLEQLKALGVELAVDDFGVGHSSLQYLHRFPLDNLKIDKKFIDGVGTGPEIPVPLWAMVDLAEIFGLRLVAEGIERPEQIPDLLALGCELGQGHHLAEPLDAEAADAILLTSGLLGATSV